MNFDSMILSVGTALRRAQEAEVAVHLLVAGHWLTGRVAGLDGEGVVLSSPDGETTIVRIQGVTAVRVEPIPARPAPKRRAAYDFGLPDASSAELVAAY